MAHAIYFGQIRSYPPKGEPLYEKDENLIQMIDEILEKYPQHKRVLFFKANYDSNKPLAITETEELKRFHKLLIAK